MSRILYCPRNGKRVISRINMPLWTQGLWEGDVERLLSPETGPAHGWSIVGMRLCWRCPCHWWAFTCTARFRFAPF